MFDDILNMPLLSLEGLLKSLQKALSVHTETLPSIHIRRSRGPKRHMDISCMFKLVLSLLGISYNFFV